MRLPVATFTYLQAIIIHSSSILVIVVILSVYLFNLIDQVHFHDSVINNLPSKVVSSQKGFYLLYRLE